MNYKLIAMDLDGTLLRDDKTISKNTIEILKIYKDNGYIIVAVTARTLNSTKAVIPLEIFNYLIVNNGASVYDVLKNKSFLQKELAISIAKKITEELEEYCTQIDFVTENDYNTYLQKKNSDLSFIKDIDTIDDLTTPVARMNIFLKENESVEEHYQTITKKYNEVNCFIMGETSSKQRWIVINPKNINKATTLKELGKLINISLDEMIYFGDGLNDLEVLKEVGLSVAMGNALEEVKKCAKCTTKTNNEDGIVSFLDEKFNRQKVKK